MEDAVIGLPGRRGAKPWLFILSTGFIVMEAPNLMAIASLPASPPRVTRVHADFSEMKPLVFPVSCDGPLCPEMTWI